MKRIVNIKLLVLGFVLQILSVYCLAQTRESNYYYQIGIDNVAKGQFEEAIDAFKMCQRLDGTKTSQDFNLGNNWHHWLGYCYYKNNDIDNARKYSDLYKYKPYNRLLVPGIDTLYNKVIVFSKNANYSRALDYLNQIEDTLASKFGKSNIYLSKIWEDQASMHYGLNHYMASTNILTKIWKLYNDSIGPCNKWHEIGQMLLRCYSAEGKRDKAIQVEPLDSNTVKIRRTKTYETGLFFMKDSITPILLLPMEYRNIEKINDRFLFVTKDLDHHFIIDFSNWTFSKNITASSVFKYITDVDGVPVFSTYDNFIDFNGKTKEYKYSFYVGTEGDLIKFELDSVFYTIPKDSIMLSNNKVKYIFPSETKLNDNFGNYYVHHIYNKDYVVVHNKIDAEIGLLRRSDSGIIQMLSCEYDEITPIFDDYHFIIKQGQFCYIFNTKNLRKTKVSAPTDRTLDEDVNITLPFDYKGKATIFCGDYRPFAIDIEGNVYHFPIGSWIEQENDKYIFHYGNDFAADVNDIPFGEMREYRIVKNNIFPIWRFSVRMDYPTDNSKLSDNIRCWMSSLLSSTNYTYIPTDKKSPVRMFQHYAYKGLNNAKINNNGNVMYATEEDSIEYNIYQQDYDAHRMWEDDDYITYVCGDAWNYGGPHGDAYTCYSTFSKMSGEMLNTIDFFDQSASKYLHKLLYDFTSVH